MFPFHRSPDEWASPDMDLIKDTIPAPPFPCDMMGHLWPTIADLAVDTGSPADFVAMGMLTMAASVVGAKRRCQPQAEGQWKEAAILWTGMVCPPSMNKSPAIRPLQQVLSRLQSEYLLDHDVAKREWRTESERAKAELKQWQDKVADATKKGLASPDLPLNAVEPKEPQPRRFYINDATPEALANILVGNPQGVVTIADELSSFLSSFERYNVNSEGFWLTAYNGDPHVVDRKGSPEPLAVPFLGVSILGGIQPDRFATAFKGANVGAAARFLWVWPDAPPYSRPTKPTDLALLERVFRNLDTLRWGSDDRGEKAPIILKLDAKADAIFDAYNRSVKEELRTGANSLLISFVGKTPGMAARLALVVEYLKWAVNGTGPEPEQISGATMETVCAFLSDYSRPMAERVYGDAARTADDASAIRLAKWIKRNGCRRFNSRDDILRKSAVHGFKTAADLDGALSILTDHHWVRECGQRQGGGVGRKTKDYLVNPKVHGGE